MRLHQPGRRESENPLSGEEGESDSTSQGRGRIRIHRGPRGIDSTQQGSQAEVESSQRISWVWADSSPSALLTWSH